MSKRKQSYPTDEFDLPESSIARTGVHRGTISPWRKILPFLVVFIAVFAVCLFAIYQLMQAPDSRVNNLLDRVSQSETPADSGSDDPAPTDGEDASDGDKSKDPADEATDTPTEDPTDEPEEPSDEAIDRAVSIRVLNAGNVNGAAAAAAKKLETDGFTAAEVVPQFEGTKPDSAVIYYLGAENKANAEHIGEVLEISNIVEVDTLRADVSVVLR
ncbi:LytR C-terminal domain-containing protein [Timonella sp. A28]|uniref:LytR C-terminal domain-containing protein n=1 Tax=Timonella sp. A28 TaxID=3442640 RepID=UPI003EB9A8BB